MTTKSFQSPSFSRTTRTLDYLTRLRWSVIDVIWMSSSITMLLQGQFISMVLVILCGAFISVMAEKLHKNRTREEMLQRIEEFDARWKELAVSGRVSDAISEYRRCYGSTIYEAKSRILAHIDKR